ncbi:peptidase [Pandoraea sputorum]|uniref:peptidase n=1 Tax=Pandoraea sputorum TaxID=93222 RepID=UPI00123FBC47|nr:peptidase [Pandoraea sputorum]VVE77403.1 hypothetical protein PSP31120_01274 [Pandoraea sputorum]
MTTEATETTTPPTDSLLAPKPADTPATDPTTGTPPEQKAADGAEAPKPEGDNKGEATGKPEGQDEKPAAPEKYEFVPPENMKFDDAVIGDFETVARKYGMSQEDAQGLLSLAGKNMQQVVQAQQDAVLAAQTEWVTSLKSDKEFGGDHFDANVQTAQQAIARFGADGFVDLLNQTGLGNHPAAVKTFLNIGKAISEAKLVQGSATAEQLSTADILYGKK